MTLYDKSKNGIITRIYADQRQHSKARGHRMPSYSKKWLKEWLFLNPEFHRLYDIWVLSGYKKDFKPSVNRLDDYIGYTEYNIELITFRDNYKKSHRDMKSGKNAKRNKSVIQFTKDNIKVNEFHSIAEAKRTLNISTGAITDCCKGNRKLAGGYKWKYKKEIE